MRQVVLFLCDAGFRWRPRLKNGAPPLPTHSTISASGNRNSQVNPLPLLIPDRHRALQAKSLAFFRSMLPVWVGWSITIPVHFWRELLAHRFSGIERDDFNECNEKTTTIRLKAKQEFWPQRTQRSPRKEDEKSGSRQGPKRRPTASSLLPCPFSLFSVSLCDLCGFLSFLAFERIVEKQPGPASW